MAEKQCNAVRVLDNATVLPVMTSSRIHSIPDKVSHA